MLLKCCTQYANKLGKFNSGHRIGKGQFSFQFQRRAVPKNVQTTGQFLSFLMLARLCSKSFKVGFSSTWAETFQVYKLDLEKAEEPEVTLPASTGSQRKQGNFTKITYLCFTDYGKASDCFDCVDHNKLWKILQEMGIPDHLTCLLRKLYAGQEATVRTGHGTMDWFNIGKRVHQSCILSPCLFNLYAEYIMQNAGLDDS